MAEQITADVVIVGAGMVGLTTALALQPSGLKVMVLEQRSLNPAEIVEQLPASLSQGFDPRVSALTCASQQILEHVGAWQTMAEMRISPYVEMDVWDGQGTGHVHFSARELHEPVLGHIVENRVTLAGLCHALTQSDVTLLGDVEVVDMQPDAAGRRLLLADGRQLSADLVIAADGAHSKVRQLAGLPMCEWDYGHHAIVTTVKTAQPHQQTAWQRFTEDGPLALLPLADGGEQRHCSIVWSTSPGHARQLMELDDLAFCAALGRSFEQRLGTVEWCDQRFLFPLRQRHAQFYVKPGFAAVGDAAHTIHPLAGQGVNLGLLDAAQLAETLTDAHARGEAVGSEEVLRRFQRARQGGNLQMAATMEAFKQLFGSDNGMLCLLRNSGMNLFQRLPAVKNHLVMTAMGLRGELPEIARRPIKI